MLNIQVVCIFEDTKTFMLLQSAAPALPEGPGLEFKAVNSNQLSRVINVKEYGSERIFLSHTRGLGSMPFHHGEGALGLSPKAL